MTREAKIGLLTGLGVIVLIGILLSEYLGPVGTPGTTTATNRMAPLPIAQTYRENVMQPIGVPGMAARSESTQVAAAPAMGPDGAAGTPPLMSQIGSLPRAFAADPASSPAAPVTPAAPLNPAPSAPSQVASDSGPTPMPTQPVVAAPVTPIKDGEIAPPVLAHAGSPNNLPSGVPMFQIEDSHPVSTTGSPSIAGPAKPEQAPITGQEYTIVSGDTLNKIARKFYGSAKPEDAQRIVTANPSSLKTTMSMLVVGKKLIIPDVAKTVDPSLRPGSGTEVAALVPVKPTIVIRSPGTKPETADAKPVEARKLSLKPETAAKKDAGKEKESGSHYVVLSGDTPERIARKFSSSPEYAKQLMAVNKIKDPRGLQVGMKLKLPAK
jgi:nucleoid-associated protein YgaU